MTLTDDNARKLEAILDWLDEDSGFMHGDRFWCMYCNGNSTEPRNSHTPECVTRIARDLKASLAVERSDGRG